MLSVRRSRAARTAGVLLAALTLAACGGSPSAPRDSSTANTPKPTPTPTATYTATPDAAALASTWMRRFCAEPPTHAAQYIITYRDAFQATASQLTVAELESTAQVMAGTVGGLDAEIVANADRLAATVPPEAVDAASARTQLLGVYKELHRALESAGDQLDAVPTTNVRQFRAGFGQVTDDVVAAIRDSQDAVQSDTVLGPAFEASPECVDL